MWKQTAKARLLLAVAIGLTISLLTTHSTNAAAGINQQMAFEGKIVLSNGTNIANGTYNMEFKIYNGGSATGGGTLQWTEDELVGGTGGVSMNNGTFAINLGANSSLSSVNWNSDTLWLSLQVGNSSSCTISTTFQSNCGGDGEMTPFIRLTSVPYAFNALELGGVAASGYGTLAGTQTWSAANTFTNSITANGGLGITGLTTQSFGSAVTANADSRTVTNSNASSTLATVNGLNIALVGTTNSNANKNVLNAINFPNVTTLANNSFTGLNFGTGYNSLLSVNGNTVINGNGVVQTAFGGTGVNSSAAANGSLLIGNGSGLSLATITNNGGITVSNGAGSLGLAVAYGAVASTAVEGNTTLTCPTVSGNLGGGGGTITLGSGGTCAGITFTNTPTFSGLATLNGGLTESGAVGITGTTTINTSGSAATSIGSGTGTFAVNSTAFDVSTLGAVSGITTLGLSGAITGATATNTINGLVISSGALSSVTGLITSGGYTQSGAGSNTFTGSTSIGSTGSSTSSSSVDIADTTSATGTQDITIGSTANAANSLSLEAGNTGQINIGTSTTAHTINIGSGGAAAGNVQNVVIGSNSTTAGSSVTLQSGNIDTTNNDTGIIIGGGFSTSDTNLEGLVLDSSDTFSETASTCTSTVNGGALYFNSDTNSIRACIPSSNNTASWEDLVSTSGLGVILFGIVPDSAVNVGSTGDLAGVGAVSANASGPCKVYEGTAALTIRWTSCVAYSGGRKIIVAAQTSNFTVPKSTSGTQYDHICLNGTGNQPVSNPAANGTGAETANLPAFSANNPILCLADVTVSTTAVTGIYDVRTFTTSIHDFANVSSATSVGLGTVVITSGTNAVTAGASATANISGVVAAWGGATTGTPNAIITVAGPTYAKATGGTAGAVVIPSATAGRVATGTSVAGPYGDLGLQRSVTWSATCTVNNATTCQLSDYFNMQLR